MNRFTTYVKSTALLAPAVLLGSAGTVLAASPSPKESACTGAGGTFANGVCTGASGTIDIQGAFKAITNTLIFVVGAVSIIMVIIGGLRYVLSGGDSAGIKGAKDTIMYAIIGVIVAIVAYALVNFAINAFK